MAFRKSNKQRRAEIKRARLERAARASALLTLDVRSLPGGVPDGELPPGAVLADHAALAHNTTYGLLPNLYLDTAFICRDCGAEQVWTAKQQKWWYEVAKGNIDTRAVRCRPCRKIERERKAEARRVHLEGLARKNAQTQRK